ncbi:MAG: ComEC/Rec2 family competence protein [Methanoregulaceae archaeon]
MKKIYLLIPLLILVFLSGGCSQIQSALKTGIPASGISTSSDEGMLAVYFIDVGQGDAVLVKSPNGTSMLIDSGPAAEGGNLVSTLRSLGVSTLDIVVATHPQDDSVGGLAAVMSAFPVGAFVGSGIPSDSGTYANLLNLAAEKNISVRTVSRGDVLDMDPLLNITVLNPPKIFFQDLSDNSRMNQNSIVLRLEYGDRSFLFMSDAETETEDALRTEGDVLKADVLKIGYHGSSASSGTKFLNTVNPEIAVIGTDTSNKYPSKTVLKRLDALGTTIYRTDLNGTIRITSDGTSLDVTTFGKETDSG